MTQLDLLTGAPALPVIDPRDCWRTPPAVVEAAREVGS
jgi:hypothetical protein